jgi:hypothetical protein
MPGGHSDRERISHAQYHIVVIVSLLRKRYWIGFIDPAFAPICQYLSSAAQDLAPFNYLFLDEGSSGNSPAIQEKQ